MGTIAVAKVITERGLSSKVRLVGQGDLPEIRDYIQKGLIDASLVESPYQIGAISVKEMLYYLKDRRINISINTNVIVLDKDNLHDYMEEGVYQDDYGIYHE